jgi:hypothetical protein
MNSIDPSKGDTTSSSPQDSQQETKNDYQLQWYKAGGENPYGVDILDIRGLTLKMVATSHNKAVIDTFNESRSSDGIEYKTAVIKNAQEYTANIIYPRKGLRLSGPVFKADSMEVKWDIYAYDDWFYFVKSWTSELIYKAHFSKKIDSFKIDKVVTGSVDKMAKTVEEKETFAAQNIHSMLQTHLMDGIWPYKIPEMMRGIPEEHIAAHMFAQFGSKATIATYGNVLDIKRPV